mmetsp:Transcript_26631/g.49451  ORF Transcript_26631/g.49451 Transcript_26631/m.49451 type:complete len:218 (-) Transcript_26631:31-684(-)
MSFLAFEIRSRDRATNVRRSCNSASLICANFMRFDSTIVTVVCKSLSADSAFLIWRFRCFFASFTSAVFTAVSVVSTSRKYRPSASSTKSSFRVRSSRNTWKGSSSTAVDSDDPFCLWPDSTSPPFHCWSSPSSCSMLAVNGSDRSALSTLSLRRRPRDLVDLRVDFEDIEAPDDTFMIMAPSSSSSSSDEAQGGAEMLDLPSLPLLLSGLYCAISP